MNAGAPPLVSRLRSRSRNAPGVKMLPAASATPGTARTRASIALVIGDSCARFSRPSVSVGETTTESPLAAALKMPAKDWLIVSVRMYVPAISATPSAIAMAVSTTRSLRCRKPRRIRRVISSDRLHQIQRLVGRDRRAVVHDAPVGQHEQPIGKGRGVRVVGDHDDRLL